MKKNKETDATKKDYPLPIAFEESKVVLRCPSCGEGKLNKMVESRSYTRNPLNPVNPPWDFTWVIECRACQTSHMRLVLGPRGQDGDYYIGYEVSQIPI